MINVKPNEKGFTCTFLQLIMMIYISVYKLTRFNDMR